MNNWVVITFFFLALTSRFLILKTVKVISESLQILVLTIESPYRILDLLVAGLFSCRSSNIKQLLKERNKKNKIEA